MGGLIWGLFAVLACTPAKVTSGPTDKDSAVIHFEGKTLDLGPYFEGYPYKPVLPIWHKKTLLFDYLGEQTRLHRGALNFEDPNVMASGTQVSSIDFDTRSRWTIAAHGEHLFYLGDERNDERINLYRNDHNSGQATALTDVPYTYGFSVSPDETQIAWLPRQGERPFVTCLSTMSLDGQNATQHVCDTPAATFTWNRPSWAPDGRGVLLRLNVGGDRGRGQLAWVDFGSPTPLILTDPAKTRTTIWALDHWLDNSHFVLQSDESGFDAIGVYDLDTHRTTWLYTTQTAITHAEVVKLGKEHRILVIEHSPMQDELLWLHPESGEILDRQLLAGTARILGAAESGQALLQVNTTQSPMQLYHLRLTQNQLHMSPWLSWPSALQSQLVQCDVQQVTFSTFDRDLHALLYTPKQMTSPASHWVRIKAFYGGQARFSVDKQIFCEAGVVTFSPAVRGGFGYGAAFSALNDGDLGGSEIADLFAAADWLTAQGYAANKIGVYGRSHGGYATMRALTFPPGTNGHQSVFPFAFGMADAGFSDIPSFYKTSNIPDWVQLEAGDPNTEQEKLADRSPIHHLDKLQAPLFLSHGENDSRVPVEGSRAMNQACIQAKKSCTYVEFPEQGHAVQGLANQHKLYEARFSFLAGLEK